MKFIRVTQPLQRYYDWDGVPEARLLHAQERGTQVHRACMAIAKGCWAVCTPEVEPYVVSFKLWMETVVEKIHAIEPELIDKDLGIKGHPDYIVTVKGNTYPSIIDLKTPIIKQKLWRLQIAAYTHLTRKNLFKKLSIGGSLRLSPEGKIPKFDPYEEDRRDFAIYLSMLNVERFLNS